MTPAAYLFDVFGTCVDWRSSIARELNKVLPHINATGFADAWRQEYQPAMERIRDGGRGYVALDELHLENLVRVAEHRKIQLSDPKGLARAWERLDPWPDVRPGLNALKQRAIIAPCSNGSIALMTHLARYADLPWDCILGAELAQDYKPKPVVYQVSCDALRLPPEQVMFVAAHNDDLAAAQAVGLQTAFVPRHREWGPGQTRDLVPDGNWTVVAKDFEALARKVGTL